MTQEEIIQEIEKKAAELFHLQEQLANSIELGDIKGKCAYTKIKQSEELHECIFDINDVDIARDNIAIRGKSGIYFEWDKFQMSWDWNDGCLVYDPTNETLVIATKEEILQVITEELKQAIIR